jgi:hypothetical protein
MDPARRLWPRADLRAGDTDRQAVVKELQRHYVEGRLTSEELGERVTHALEARTFGDLAALLTDLPPLADTVSELGPGGHSNDPDWHSASSWFTPSLGMLFLLIGVVVLFAMIALPTRGAMFFPWPLLIWGFFIFGRPFRGRRF